MRKGPTIDQLREYRHLMQAHRERKTLCNPQADKCDTKSENGSALEPESNSLVDIVKNDIVGFIGHQCELMFNERDFQMQLAFYLASSGHYDDVEIEYFIPNSIAEGYDWDSNLYIDIVVRKGDEYLPVELKYTTTEVRKDICRFGQVIRDVPIIRHQGADNNIRYNFWKDIRRIELIRKLFPQVKNGLAVMLTCDKTFLNAHQPTVASYPFSMNEGFTNGQCTMDWVGNVKGRGNHPPFTLDNKYTIHWEPADIEQVNFYYTIVKI